MPPDDPALATDWLVENYFDVLADCVMSINNDLDANCASAYKQQPLAQDWARITKVAEELGEAVAEYISATGQNPRKVADLAAWDRMLDELADTALTAIYAMQHFTDDTNVTLVALLRRSMYHCKRRDIVIAQP